MQAINIKGDMSTHVAEGKLHCPPPEFPSQVEGPFPDQHHARNGENAKESSNGGGVCKNDLQDKNNNFDISTHQRHSCPHRKVYKSPG